MQELDDLSNWKLITYYYFMNNAYGKTAADPNWNEYRKADVNNDGKADIEDLAAVARMILN